MGNPLVANPSPYEGVSNPPNNGEVSTITPPPPEEMQSTSQPDQGSSGSSFVPPAAAANTTPGTPAPTQAPAQTTTAPASMAGGTPTEGAAPAVRKTAGFVPMSDVGKPFHTTMSDPAVQHGFLHSKLMQAIEGKSDQYVQPVDADGNPTGAPVLQQKQNSPGFFFRSLLAGALAGAASGAGHGVAGAGMGWNAATEMQDKQKAEAHAQAQEQWQNQRQATEDAQKADTADQQKLVSQAQIKMYQHNIIASQHQMDFEDQGRIDKINDSTKAMMDVLEARGAQDPKDLPPIMNFYALRDKVVETKGAALHPDNDPTEQNSHRIFVDTITGDQEKWDPDQNAWTDQTTGKPMDKTANTNVRIYDVPVDSMTKLFPMDKAQVNKLAGETVFPNPEGTVNVSLDRVIGLGNKFREQQNMKRANDNASREQGEREYKDLFDLTKAQNDELLKQQKELQPTDPNYKALQKQMDDGWKGVLDRYQDLHPGTKKKKEDIVNPPPPDKVAALAAKYSSGLSPTASTTLAALAKSGKSLSAVLQYVASAPDIAPQDKMALSSAYQKFYAEANPIQQQNQQDAQEATRIVQNSADQASAQEHPVSSAIQRAAVSVGQFPSR